MSRFTEWFLTLGEKTGRSDIWVVLIVILTLGSFIPNFLCAINWLQCDLQITSSLLTFTYFLTGGLFTDMGISHYKDIKLNN